jgi:3-phosphoshikimate 1-carboxyvinyltransferase
MSASAPLIVTVDPEVRVRGEIRVPGDKSISHRYAMLAAVAEGPTRIENFAPGADCASTLACLAGLGVSVEHDSQGPVQVIGRGLGGLTPPEEPLDAGNSGSTLRMLAGILAAHPFPATLTGDESLRRRPMRRVIDPLVCMGARIRSDDGRPPLSIEGGPLQAVEWTPSVPSAQVKSAVLFAGLHAQGRTVVRETALTRDHTERALAAFGARVDREGLAIAVEGGQRLEGQDLDVPGDVSSATFWCVAAAGLLDSEIVLPGVGMNPTRAQVFAVLRRAGAEVVVDVVGERAREPLGRVVVRHSKIRPVVVAPAEVPGLIDELPALAALATFGGHLTVTGAAELRAKESDRITALVDGLRALGGLATELPDGFVIDGSRRLTGGTADARGDHRLAMAFAVAALGAETPCRIAGAEAVSVSYPGFFGTLSAIRG